jgi:peptidyl-prolyl cis-trans isomerase C
MKIWKALAFSIVIATAGLIVFSGCGNSTKSGKVIVKVNGDKITEGDLEFLGEINPRIKSELTVPEGRSRILDNLVEQSLLYQKATKEGINRDATVKAKIDLYRRVIIAQALVEKEIEDAAKKYYSENPDEFKMLGLSLIEVSFNTPEEITKAKGKKGETMRTEEEALKRANELKAKIQGGTSFEQIAKEYSDSAATKARGGNMGLVSKKDRRLVALGYEPVLEKAFEMKVGDVSNPIKTTNGYSLITVTRGVELEPFESAKQSILFRVTGDTRQGLLAKLKKDAEITYAEGEKKIETGEKAAEKTISKAVEELAKKKALDEKATAAKVAPKQVETKTEAAKTPSGTEVKKAPESTSKK